MLRLRGPRSPRTKNTIFELNDYLESRMSAEPDAKPDKVKRTRRPVERG